MLFQITQHHLIIKTAAEGMIRQVHQAFIRLEFPVQDHMARQAQHAGIRELLISVFLHQSKGSFIFSVRCQKFDHGRFIHTDVFFIAEFLQRLFHRSFSQMLPVIVQKLLTDQAAVFFGKGRRMCCLLVPSQLLLADIHFFLCLSAQIKQQSGIVHIERSAGARQHLVLKQRLVFVADGRGEAALLFILQEDPRFLPVHTDISGVIGHRVRHLMPQCRMAYDDSADLAVFTGNLMGKQNIRQSSRADIVLGHRKKFIVDPGIILVDPALLHFNACKVFHRLFVTLPGVPVFFLVFDHIRIDECFFLPAEGIVVCEVYTDHLRKHSVKSCSHGLNVILVKPCDAQFMLHRKGIPPEIFRPRRLSLHDQLADCLQHLVGRVLIIAFGQKAVNAGIKIFQMAAQISGTFQDFLRHYAVTLCKAQHLDHKSRHLAKLSLLAQKHFESFQIQKRACAAHPVNLFHGIQLLCQRNTVSVILTHQQQKQDQVLRFLAVKSSQPREDRPMLRRDQIQFLLIVQKQRLLLECCQGIFAVLHSPEQFHRQSVFFVGII